MQRQFQPTWKGDVKREKIEGKEMWGNSLEEQRIDQSISYQKKPTTQRKSLDTHEGISMIQKIIGVPHKNGKHVDTSMDNIRGELAGQHSEIHTATMVKMTRKQSFKDKQKDKKAGKKDSIQSMYKKIRTEDKKFITNTGKSMALQVVNRTASMAKVAGQNHLNRHVSYVDLLAKVQKAEEAQKGDNLGPPDLPIGLPRGRLITTHVFLLGRKMRVELLRIGRDAIKYEVTDDEMRSYVIETTERRLFESLSPLQQEKIVGAHVDEQIPMLIGRLGFRINKEDKRKKELAIIESKIGLQESKAKPTASGRKWSKIKKLTTDIGEDMFQRRINANSEDIASMVGLGMLKAKQGKDYEAALLFVRAIREANIVTVHPETGNHRLIPGAANLLSSKNAVFNANFWNTMARTAFETYLDDLRLQVLNLALDSSEIASRFIENLANQKLWILRGRIHESLGHLQAASDLYEQCISKFTHGDDLHEVMFRAAAVAKRLGRFTRCIAYMEYSLIKPPPGFSQKDILFQISRVHEQEGKVDIASDGFRHAFKFVKKSGNSSSNLRSWRDWINRQDSWDKQAAIAFTNGYYSIAIDMIQRSLMLGERRIKMEALKPFGGESEKLIIEASHRWWMAAVSARHLGELHTSLKACEEAVSRDPTNSTASVALEKWNEFFLKGGEADKEDPDMIMDAEAWAKVKYTDDVSSDGLKHAMEKQTKAALKMESFARSGKSEGKVAKEVRDVRRTSRRLSVVGSQQLGAAAAATTAANLAIASKIMKSDIRDEGDSTEALKKEENVMDDEEDARRLARKRGGRGARNKRKNRRRPMSAKLRRNDEMEKMKELNKLKEVKELKKKKSAAKKRMDKLVGSALRRLVIMGNQDIQKIQLKINESNSNDRFGFASTSAHAFVAAILLKDKSLLPADIRSEDYIKSVDSICGQLDSGVLLSSSRPSLRDLRTEQRSPSAKSMALSMLSPNGKRASSITSSQPSDQIATAQTERLFRGRMSSSYDFLNNVSQKVLSSSTTETDVKKKKKLNEVVEKAILSHSLTNKQYKRSLKNSNSSSNKKSNKRRSGNDDEIYMRLTRKSTSTTSDSRSRIQRRWKREKTRQIHCQKNRRNWIAEEMEFQKTKPAIVLREDGKNVLMKDPILMSKIGSIIPKTDRLSEHTR
jgi:tetratricopeptide (TPR) repeat protein